MKGLRRCFLVACPRSGTTLLQAMLAGHPAVQAFPETHFFDGLYWGKRAALLRGLLGRRLLERLSRRLGCPDLELPRPGWRRRPHERAYLRLLDTAARRAEAAAWVEKTPPHLHFIPAIVRVAPDARFIHLLRDGRAVVASLFEVGRRYPHRWPWARSLDACIARWNRSLRDHLFWSRRAGHLLCRYEQLVTDPENDLRRACALLGQDFDPAMLRFQDRADAIVWDFETWKAEVRGPLRDPGLAKYRRLFDAGCRRAIEARLLTGPRPDEANPSKLL